MPDNKFISVLKKIGLAAMAADQFIPIYGPMVHAITSSISTKADDKATSILQATSDGLHQLEALVVHAEAMGSAIGAPGTQKAAMLAPAAFQLLMDGLTLTRGKKPKDPESARTKAAAAAAAIADFINEFEG